MTREMKYSGVEWIGDIPSEWKYSKLKYFYVFEKGTNAATYTQEYIGQNVGEYPVYSGQTENDGVMGKINSYDYDIEECLFTTTVGAKVMTPKILKGKFSLSQNCLIMKKIKECNNRFMYYTLISLFDYEKKMIPIYMQPSLRMEDLKKYAFYFPSLLEQKKIADFLDGKVAEIDKIIAETKSSIENYKEYKQSVITEAVTKGLDKNVPMKDSGIEWIGDIPVGWEIMPLKYKCILNEETLTEKTDPNYEFMYIEIGSVSLDKGINKYEKMMFKNSPSRARRIVRENNIIISTVRTYLKAIAVIPNIENIVVSTGFAVIKPKNIFPKYLGYMLKTNYFTNSVSAKSVGVSYPAINASDLIQFKILVPTKKEQQKIADFLDSIVFEIDNLISEKEKLISNLEEYKKSLIYEYVTGKRTV